MKSYLNSLYSNAVNLNRRHIINLIEVNKDCHMLDLGCDDGKYTLQLSKKAKTKHIFGIDITTQRLAMARKRGVIAKKADLCDVFPYSSNTFDLVHANQVIEHIGNLDKFMGEIYRVTKKGGYVIISTENASSWANIFSLIMGWQMFSLTNISSIKQGIGNPLALHRGEKLSMSSWTHKTIFSLRGLREFCEAHGFLVEKGCGAGYFPFPAILGNIDRNHAHFITLKLRKR